MTRWCLQDNECLACGGGCVGYDSKKEKMKRARKRYWQIVNKLIKEEERKKKNNE